MPKKSKSQTIEQLEVQIANLTAALQRERADASNIRRRHEEQIINLKKNIKSQVVEDLLPTIDNFERSLSHIPNKLIEEPFVKGIEGVVRLFQKTLSDIGVEKIKTIGEVFDPELHEATSMEEGDGEQMVVTEEIQAGYKIGNQVIRHAMVKVKRV